MRMVDMRFCVEMDIPGLLNKSFRFGFGEMPEQSSRHDPWFQTLEGSSWLESLSPFGIEAFEVEELG